MASGKSTVGRQLANVIEYKFLDLDDNIEDVSGLTIPEIFSTMGEPGFREMERHALDSTAALQDVVVAVGGGALANKHSLHFALQHGTVVFLSASTEVLTERLSRTDNRPLIRKHGSNLDAYVRDKLAQRLPYYQEAHFTVETDGKSPGQLSSEIASLIRAV